MNMRSIKQLTLGTCAAMLVPLMSPADGYQFIISGDPVAAATVNSKASASAGTALVTSTRTFWTVASSLEARFRSMDKSDGISLRTDKFKGIVLLLR